ncbi:MAG: hypothetical protein Q9217_006232 [Psora testacea]
MASRQSSSLLDPAAITRHEQLTAQKARTTKIARDEEAFIRERMRKKGTEHLFPKYRFVDFIGKGTYGRVFQAYDFNHDPPRDVAIKLMNVDDVDYLANGMEKDETLKDVKNEINILMQLKDSQARNVNLIYDVLEVDGHLWIVCEHCPGGSLRTLLRASNNRCEEKYIKVIARELAIGLSAIHEANVIHRDLKGKYSPSVGSRKPQCIGSWKSVAANVMIHEKGGLQIIDFGVAGTVESQNDKRMTFIGTPHWMAPEQHKAFRPNDLKYGFEVDVWAYAITIYEIANGAPPHVQLPPNRLAAGLRSRPPRLTEDKFSKELCDFVEFVAQVDPESRPSTKDILRHPYVRGSEETHPTVILKDLVDKFLDWSLLGGQRTSLFLGSGAQAASDFAEGRSEDIDFIFCTSQDLVQDLDPTYDVFANSPPGTLAPHSFQINSPAAPSLDPEAFTSQLSFSQDSQVNNPPKLSLSTDFQDPSTERRVARGGQALEALFDSSQEPYEYNIRSGDMPLDKPILSRAKSDLPLRNIDSSSSDLARKEVDFNESSSSKSDVELADADTIKQKRKQQPKEKRDTMGWQPDWGNLEANMDNEDGRMPDPPSSIPMARPALIHAETAPERVTQTRASTATLNLDDMMGDDDWMAGSALGSFSSLPTPLQEEDTSIRPSDTDINDEPFDSYAVSFADISASEDESIPLPAASYLKNSQMNGRKMTRHADMYEEIAPPNAGVMRDDAPHDIVEAEVKRLLSGFMGELTALGDEFPTEGDVDDEYGDGDSEEGEFDDGGINVVVEAFSS